MLFGFLRRISGSFCNFLGGFWVVYFVWVCAVGFFVFDVVLWWF